MATSRAETLADTSAWITAHRVPSLRAQLRSGGPAICDMVKLELLRGARNGPEFDRRRVELDLLDKAPIGEGEWRRAIDVYAGLAHQGGSHQRAVSHADLLIAAAAEAAGLEVLHYDADFDRIAAVTGQATRWIAPRGSL